MLAERQQFAVLRFIRLHHQGVAVAAPVLADGHGGCVAPARRPAFVPRAPSAHTERPRRLVDKSDDDAIDTSFLQLRR